MRLLMLRGFNLLLTAAGATVLGALFLYITLAPEDFDQRTKEFAIAKVEDKFDEQFGRVANSQTVDKFARVAGRFSDGLKGRIEEMRAGLDAGMAEFIADVLAAACKLDCERRDEAAKAVRAFFEAAIARYGFAIERVTGFIEGKYDEVMGELRRDLKIFAGSSFAVLLFAFLLSVFRGRAAAHLLPISLALTAATAFAVAWYVFGQDWVMTIIFSNYWGWGYAGFLGVISVLLVDIAANRARVTSAVLNTVGNAFGGAFSFTPC